MKKLFALALAVVGLTGCPPKASATPPLKPVVSFRVDSARIQVACPAAGPNISCTLTSLVDSVSNTNLLPGGPATIAVGSVFTTFFHCTAPGASMVVKVIGVGNAPGVPPSMPGGGRGAFTCPLPGAVTPTFTVIITGG